MNPVAVSRFLDVGNSVKSDKMNEGYQWFYPRFLGSFRSTPIRLLEIGYRRGHSARLWRRYLPKATLSFMDKRYPPGGSGAVVEGIKFHLKDQTIYQDNLDVCREDGPFDLVVDDGAHTMVAIRTSMTALLSCVKPGGFYIVEDLHTAYGDQVPGQKYFGGGLHSSNSVMNIFKDLIDVVNRKRFNSSFTVVPGDELVTGIFCFKSACILEVGSHARDVYA
ncbi:hypothetical protein CYMTET_2705 [Cymbomonas tetramitiformis]|uniref:Uncharacterized protein n=1 Tax=Cymbomonas tetramitiformis TaxID=36881 RepID=A0AAE0H4S9_9CHLO|nr:hypothetical protein CYMTET_2705 [Cymbomonas tetramitiformis]